MEGNFSLWNVLLRKLGILVSNHFFLIIMYSNYDSYPSPRATIGRLCSYFSTSISPWTPQTVQSEFAKFIHGTMVAHIHTLLKFSNQPHDLTGILLCATGEATRLEIGLTGQLFKAPLALTNVITDMWMKHMQIATRQANIHLTIDIPDFPLS